MTLRDIDEDLALHGSTAELEQHLTLLGIAGIIDPPRPEVRQSVTTLHQAGIQVVMITGDHAVTARAIALKLGIVTDLAPGWWKASSWKPLPMKICSGSRQASA